MPTNELHVDILLICAALFVVDNRKLEVPKVWDVEHDIIRYNMDFKFDGIHSMHRGSTVNRVLQLHQ